MNAVRDIRVELGFSQPEFGDLFGVGQATVSQWENGHKRPNGFRREILLYFLAAVRTGKVNDIDARFLLRERGSVYVLWWLLNLGMHDGL